LPWRITSERIDCNQREALANGKEQRETHITGRPASGWVSLRALAKHEAQNVPEIKVGVDPANNRVTETTEVLSMLALDPAAFQGFGSSSDIVALGIVNGGGDGLLNAKGSEADGDDVGELDQHGDQS
jgi:hypothetical protein